MKNWTTAEMPANLSDKPYIITGTNSGIGTVMADELAKRGARVIAANRNVEKAQKAIDEIHNKTDDLDTLKILRLEGNYSAYYLYASITFWSAYRTTT